MIKKMDTELEDFEKDAICDRLEGWELVEFLQISIERVLEVAEDNEWINEDNYEDLMDFVGLEKDNGDDG